MIGATVSHYRILEKLGEGGMGIVYLAEDVLLGRRVAIKTLTATRGSANQHFRTRFLREARAASRLSHPHIATVYDYGETQDGQPYLVMELVRGKTLSDLIREESLTIPRSIEIVREVAEALSEAHRHGLVHRDIKPSNIAINERGSVKVLDFGLAKEVLPAPGDGISPSATHANTQTREGIIVGTPMYLSPEQALGVEVDARSDLFSLGSVLYECITGQPAFGGKSDADICAKVIRDDPPVPSQLNENVSQELGLVTMTALAKKAEARYQTADELINELNALEGDRAGQTAARIRRKEGTRTTHARTMLSDIFTRPRLSIGYILTGVVIAGLITFGGWRLTRGKKYEPTPEAHRLYVLGLVALRDGASYRATKLFEEAIKEDYYFPLAHANLAEAWSELDYTDRAKDELIRAADLLPDRSTLPLVDGLRFQAVTDTLKRDFAKAIEGYSAITSQVVESEKAAAYFDLGRSYERNEQLDKAIESYIEATKRSTHYAAAFLRLGIAYGRNQDMPKAETAFDEALRLYQLSSDLEGTTEVLFQRGSLLNSVDRFSDARSQLKHALDIAISTKNKPHQIKIQLQLSSVAYSEGDAAAAKQLANAALETAKAEGLDNLTTSGLVDIGNLFFSVAGTQKPAAILNKLFTCRRSTRVVEVKPRRF